MTLITRSNTKAIEAISAEVGLDWGKVADVLKHLPEDVARDRIIEALTYGAPHLGSNPAAGQRQAESFTDAFLAL